MPRLLRVVFLFALAFASLLSAQPRFSGEPFPLTSTRYRAAAGYPRLVSNGREVFLFWQTETHFRFTRPAWGSPAPSRVIMENTGGDTWDVVWTGTHFLFVAGQTHFTSQVEDDDIVGQLIDTNGELAGEPFLLADGGQYPHIAFDGTSVLLLFYRGDSTHGSHVSEIQALRLKPDGTRVSEKVTGVRGVVQSLASNGRSFAAVVSDRFERKLVMFDGNGATTASTPLVTDFLGVGRIASNGDRYLLADAAANSLVAQLVDNDGSLGPPLVLDALNGWYAPATSIAWAGSNWTIAYSKPDNIPGSFTVVRLDANGRTIEQREESAGTGPSLATAGDQVSLAWMPVGVPGVIHIAPGVVASYAAAEQNVRATASATHGTLVLWEEGAALHGGLRALDGSWKECLVWPHPAFAAWAASDGHGFAVVVSSSEGVFLLRLDGDGKPLGEALLVRIYPQDLLWTGREYALIGFDGNEAVAATLTAAGTLSAPKRIPSTRIATSGNGFFAVSLIEPGFQTPPLPPMGVEGIRLGPDFEPLDASPTRFVLETVYDCDVAWDGTQYVVAWSGDQGVMAAQVGSPLVRTVTEDRVGEMHLTEVAGGVAIDWDESQYRFLLADGTMTPITTLRPGSNTQIASLPDGGAAIVQTAIENAVPVEGSARVTMSVISAVPLPQRAQSPDAKAIAHGDTVELRWTAPSQPVNGYRVEYRIEDRPWVEIENALTPDQTSVSIATQGKKTALRVRAWNDAGLGEYSATVFVNAGRRRSIR